MITVVANKPQFHDFIRTLRNDERVQGGFIEDVHITPDEQDAYMAIHGDDYIVALSDGVPAGYAGSVEGDIRVCTHPDFQGEGVGRALIAELMLRYPDAVARVKPGNLASRRLFESCGFEVTFLLMEPRRQAADDSDRASADD